MVTWCWLCLCLPLLSSTEISCGIGNVFILEDLLSLPRGPAARMAGGSRGHLPPMLFKLWHFRFSWYVLCE